MVYPFKEEERRQQHDEDQDDMMDDIEIDPFSEELSLESLTDVKAPSITEWILQPAVSRSIARELKSFFWSILMLMVNQFMVIK